MSAIYLEMYQNIRGIEGFTDQSVIKYSSMLMEESR